MESDRFSLSLEELQDLSRFWSEEGEAISVYFQPPVPSELKHREAMVLPPDEIAAWLRFVAWHNTARALAS